MSNIYELIFGTAVLLAFLLFCRWMLFGPQHHEFNPDGLSDEWRRARFLAELRRAK